MNRKKAQELDISGISNITIRNFHPAKKLPLNNNKIRSLVLLVIEKELCSLKNLELSFVTDRELKSINKRYLKHDYNTDIIAFSYGNQNNGIDGECIISLDSVKKNAILYNSGYKNELKRVIVHGCLHLTGYKDRTKKEKERIKEKENLYIG